MKISETHFKELINRGNYFPFKSKNKRNGSLIMIIYLLKMIIKILKSLQTPKISKN